MSMVTSIRYCSILCVCTVYVYGGIQPLPLLTPPQLTTDSQARRDERKAGASTSTPFPTFTPISTPSAPAATSGSAPITPFTPIGGSPFGGAPFGGAPIGSAASTVAQPKGPTIEEQRAEINSRGSNKGSLSPKDPNVPLDLRGQQYSNCSFSEVTNTILTNANLKNSSFTNARLKKANLGGANLEGANFSNAIFDDCSLDSAQATQANFSGATFTNKCHLVRVDFTGANLSNVKFNDAILNGAIFAPDTNIEGADFSRTTGANLTRTKLASKSSPGKPGAKPTRPTKTA